MFKFPYNWLVRESEIPVEYDKLMQWLAEQGFEIESLEDLGDDKLIEIEVKANRPDMLYVAGVLREYYMACNQVKPKSYDLDLGFKFNRDTTVLGHKFNIKSSDVHRYYAVGVKNINNNVKTPDYIEEVLSKLGINLINPVVDISNYVMLLIGQPTHIFDSDKVKGEITIQNIANARKFKTLAGAEVEFPSNTLMISDEEKDVCVAGIIGGEDIGTDSNTKNIIIESANFDHIVERLTSKKSHVSTLASYRYERGVSIKSALLGANIIAKMIKEICGGEIVYDAFGYEDQEFKPQVMTLSVEETNKLLGSTLTAQEVAKNLTRCFFDVKILSENELEVTVPDFRLDIEYSADLIEEVGRIYGYHNIVPQPIKLPVKMRQNIAHDTTQKLREFMVGFGGIECLTYGFIPADAMETMKIAPENKRFFGDIKIQNPLSAFYALMRPTLAYNLIETAVKNIKDGAKKVNIFELGHTFFRDKGFEDGYNQRNSLGVVLQGVNQPKGFGIIKDNNFTIYDALGMIQTILGEFNTKYEIQKTTDLGFFKNGTAGYIVIDGEIMGCVGVVDIELLKKFDAENIVNADMIYLELDYDKLFETKKKIQHERLFPSVTREYNFIVKNGNYFADYKNEIYSASEYVINVKPIDVYTGKGIEKGTASVLVEVEYNANDRIMQAEEVEQIENAFYKSLKEKYDIVLKS